MDVSKWCLREEAKVAVFVHGNYQSIEQRPSRDIEANREGSDEDFAVQLLLHIDERNGDS